MKQEIEIIKIDRVYKFKVDNRLASRGILYEYYPPIDRRTQFYLFNSAVYLSMKNATWRLT